MDDDLQWQLRLTYYVVAPPVIFLIFTTNILILVLIFRSNKLRTRTNVCVASWAVCDVIIGLVLLAQVIFMGIRNLAAIAQEREVLTPIYTSADNDSRHLINDSSAKVRTGSLYLCVFWASLQLLPLVVSCLHWVFLALERYIAIMDAVHYEARITCKRVKSCIMTVWGYGLLWSAVPFVWHNSTTSIYGYQFCNLCIVLAKYYILLLVLLHFIPCLLVTIAIFTRMFMHVRAHQRQVHVTHTMTQDRLLEDFHIARSYLIAFVMSVIFWSPFFISSLIGVITDFPEGIQTSVSTSMLIGVVASAGKLPVYMLANKDFKKAFKDMFAKRPLPLSRHRY